MAWHRHLVQTYADDRFRIKIKLEGVYRKEDGERMLELIFQLINDPSRPQKLEAKAETDVVTRSDGLWERKRVYTVYRMFKDPWKITARCDRKMSKL